MERYGHNWSSKARHWLILICASRPLPWRARLILVTGNVRHFERVPDLVVENWLV